MVIRTFLFTAALALAGVNDSFLIRNATVHPVSGPKLDNASVMVVDGKKIAHKREVEVGEVIADSRVILSGLKAGETVIIEGGYELPDGVQVQVGTAK